MSREAVRIGGKVWRRLIDAGGYVYTARDGTMSIHFHRGVKPTRELVDLVRLHRRELRMFVSEWHARDDARRSAAPPWSGPSGRKSSQFPERESLRDSLTNES